MQNLKIPEHLQGDPCRRITLIVFGRNMSETLTLLTIPEYICPNKFLGALFHLNRHLRRNSYYGTHGKWVYDKINFHPKCPTENRLDKQGGQTLKVNGTVWLPHF
jgi:hypothetical protein